MSKSRGRPSRKKPSGTILKPKNARELAFVVLDEHKRTELFVSQILEKRFSSIPLPTVERRFANELIYGLVRRQATLNAILALHVSRPRQQVEGALWTLLQMGVYQLVSMSSVPAHAAVHETVELARRLDKPRWSGFLNGVLRSVSGMLSEQPVEGPAIDAIPLTDGRYQHYGRPLFPDPKEDPAEYFARAFSFPSWLARRWEQQFEWERLLRLGFWFNTPSTATLRVNALKTDCETVIQKLEAAEITATLGKSPPAVRLHGGGRIERLPGFEEGWFSVQDETAMLASRLLSPQPGESILDMCAGSGTKTCHLAEIMNNQGSVTATDVLADRLDRLQQSCVRLGIDIVETQVVSADGSDLPAGPFDAILVDAPCSNSGVLGKRPEARWRLTPGNLAELTELQVRLLQLAADRLTPTGRLVYSTCSIEPEENRGVVESFLQTHTNWKLAEECIHHPGEPADGGFMALMVRR